MSETDERWAGYTRAQVRVDDLDGRTVLVRPEPHTRGRFPFDATAHVLTAANPGAHRLGPAENERRQRDLVAELPGEVRRWSATAGAADGSHEESSVVVVGLSDEQARAIGRRWGQDAVFRWTADAWTILPCGDRPPVTLGWSAIETC